MIIDALKKAVSEMKKVRRREIERSNQAQQEVTDQKYHSLVMKVNTLTRSLRFAFDNLQFCLADSTRADMTDIIAGLSGLAKTGAVNKENVDNYETLFKGILAAVGREWNKHFSSYATPTINTLKVISGIQPEQSEACIAAISAARIWPDDISVLESLQSAIKKADSLINTLNMDDEIKLFLTRMASGRATVEDLSDSVLAWIRREKISSKFKLSFLSR